MQELRAHPDLVKPLFRECWSSRDLLPLFNVNVGGNKRNINIETREGGESLLSLVVVWGCCFQHKNVIQNRWKPGSEVWQIAIKILAFFLQILPSSWNALQTSGNSNKWCLCNSEQSSLFLWEPKYVMKMSKEKKYMMQ